MICLALPVFRQRSVLLGAILVAGGFGPAGAAREFGRTPRINPQAGRDHWPQAMSIMLAGGGAPGGLVYGATDRNGAFVTDRSHTPADFACSVYALLGIDPHQHYPAPNGQPTPIVRDGEPIRAVVGG